MNTRLIIASTLLCAGLAQAASPEIARASERRDSAGVRAQLAKKADVNAAQTDGTTALHWAAHWNDVETARLLVKAGANVSATNRFGASPLSEAAALGSKPLVELLLTAGASAKALTSLDGETVLMTAARAGNDEVVKLLIDRGADVNAKESFKGQTALMWAAAEKHPGIVKTLLAAGADWRVLSSDHETKMPKLSAASSVTPMPRGGLSALHFAAREGDLPTIQAFLDNGVDINHLDVDKTSALTAALMNKRYTAAKFLLDRGANPNLQDATGRTPLYAAIDMRNEDYSATPGRPALDLMPSVEIIKALLDRGANPGTPLKTRLPGRSGMDGGDTTLGEGTTPLMRAARAGDAEVMRLLLQKGADPAAKTKEGNTAFLLAAGIGYRDKNTSGTEAQALEAVKLALEIGGDVNQVNLRDDTALHGAAGRGADTIIAFLASKGAKLDARSRSQQTALDIAMGKNSFGALPVPHDSSVALLRKLGAHESSELPKPAAK
jgi:ankyrin repeat protein